MAGRRAVAEALRANVALRVLADAGAPPQGLGPILAEARALGIEVEAVDRGALDRRAGPRHQGVMAVVRPPTLLDDRALDRSDFPADALVVMLDGIEDPQNLGACARSAEAAGVAVLVVRDRRGAPVTPAAVRASAGALLHLPVARVTNLARVLHRLKERSFTVVGLDHEASRTIQAGPPPGRPLVMVVGAEGAGLSRLVREACDELVAIPMAGSVGSLNASAALAVGLFGYAMRPPEA